MPGSVRHVRLGLTKGEASTLGRGGTSPQLCILSGTVVSIFASANLSKKDSMRADSAVSLGFCLDAVDARSLRCHQVPNHGEVASHADDLLRGQIGGVDRRDFGKLGRLISRPVLTVPF